MRFLAVVGQDVEIVTKARPVLALPARRQSGLTSKL